MLRIAICEDLHEDAALLCATLEAALSHFQTSGDIRCYTSGEDLIQAVGEDTQFDLCLLDIFLPQKNGVDTARAVQKQLPHTLIAFITTSRDYAVEAFDLDAFYYLIKPVSLETVKSLLSRYFQRRGLPTPTLTIQTPTKPYSFPLEQVLKIQSSNKGVEVYLQGDPSPHRIPLSFVRVEKQLDPERFLKISRGLLVQMDAILCMDKDTCQLKDGTSALMSRRERTDIRRRYNDYLFRKP